MSRDTMLGVCLFLAAVSVLLSSAAIVGVLQTGQRVEVLEDAAFAYPEINIILPDDWTRR